MTTHASSKPKPYVGIISCGKAKLPHAAKARDLYIGDLFLLQRNYIERVTDDWYILSAKYGLVARDQVIEPYEQRVTSYNARQYDVWLKHVQHQVRATFPTYTRFLSTCPAPYRKALPVARTICPWPEVFNMGLGRQRQWLIQQAKHPTWRANDLGLTTDR